MRPQAQVIGWVLAGWIVAVGVGVAAAEERVIKGTVALPAGAESVRDVVVSLDGVPATATPREATIDLKNLAFVPRVTPVVVGSTVKFANGDAILHNVVCGSAIKRFDLGMYPQGESRSVTFDQAGVARVTCNVHPNMEAFVVVLEHAYFATPDERGRFQITGVPPGRYKIRAWHPSLKPFERAVDLQEIKVETIDIRLKR